MTLDVNLSKVQRFILIMSKVILYQSINNQTGSKLLAKTPQFLVLKDHNL